LIVKETNMEIDKLRKKIKEEAEKHMELDESDIPVHERFAKEEHLKRIKKKSRF